MIKMYLKALDIKILVLMLLALIASPTLCGKNTYTICLIYSHFLTMYMNNLYLMLMYQQVDRINLLNDSIITRIGANRFYLYNYLELIIVGIVYNLIIYISYYFFFGSIPQNDIQLTFFFMILNIIITSIENSIIYLQLGKKKKFAYLALPIIINLLFHLAFTQTL